MKKYVQRQQATPKMIQSKASNQASAEEVLQSYKKKIVQMQSMYEDEPLQGKFNDTAQREELDEEELLQGKFDTAQREEIDEDELLQGKFEASSTIQREEVPSIGGEEANNTGMPDNLKNGIESLSGYSMDDVRVHYNSPKPAQLQALAYAQGTDIHIAPGQKQHLPHEAWHVVQQKQGRVQPTTQLQGINVNDNEGLEKEADVMGGKALSAKDNQLIVGNQTSNVNQFRQVIQAFALANVVLDIDKNEVPYVYRINFKERVPTTTPGSSQGDHTVAEALIQASIKSLEYNYIDDFLLGLIHIMEVHLEGIEIAMHTSESGDKYQIRPLSVYYSIIELLDQYQNQTINPLFIPQALSDVTTKVWRLLSKRDLTAFDRKADLTTGGGFGSGEYDSMQEIHSLEVPQIGWNYNEFIYRVANILLGLIDVNINTMRDEMQRKIFRRAAEHVGDVLGIESSDWKNRVAAAIYNLKHEETDGLRMAPAPAPVSLSFDEYYFIE